MGRFSVGLVAFNGGEISPLLEGRADLAHYAASGRRVENFLPTVQGPLVHRSGTRFVKAAKYPGTRTILIPFVVSTVAAYVIEAGHLYFRFYTSEARLESGGIPVELVTTYTAAELDQLRWAQSADTLYIVHPNHVPRKLVRVTATSFAIADVDFLDGPFLDENTDTGKTLTASAGTGNITITAVGHAPFLAGRDEGRHVRERSGGNVGWAQITSVVSDTVVNATVRSASNMPGAARYEWRLGEWYVGNYPRTVTFHEGRLCFGGAPASIQRLDLSVSSDFERFSPTGSPDDGTNPYSVDDVFDDNAIAFTIGSDELNAILWARVRRVLVLGTAGSLFQMAASTQNEALTPTNVNVREDDMIGASDVQPGRIATAIVFASRSRRSLQAVVYSIDEDGNVANDLTQLADHITGAGIADIAVTREPLPLVWIRTVDGALASLTFEPTQKVFGWARHVLGGSGIVKSIAAIPVEGEDQLWVLVERTIDGQTVQYVEFLEELFRWLDASQPLEDAFFVDSGVSYSGAPATVFTGLEHLEGATVKILADGARVPDAVVEAGQITLAVAASTVHVGLGRSARFESVRLETPDPEGTSIGKRRAIDTAILRVRDTLGGAFGLGEGELVPLIYRTARDAMDEAPPIFTGEIRVAAPGGWTNEPRVRFEQEDPLPATLLAVGLYGAGSQR